MCRHPFPLDIWKLRDRGGAQLGPDDGSLLPSDQRKYVGVIAVDTYKVIMDSLAPSVKVGHITIISFEFLARFLAVD